jgi:peroxin-14
MDPPVREDMIASAVRFLKDEKVAAAPLTKKIAFLESKGLTQLEIDAAVAQSSGAKSPTSLGIPDSTTLPIVPARPIHSPASNSWGARDILLTFAALCATGGVAYQLVSKYVTHRFPSYTALSDAQKEFQRALIATSQAVDAVQADARAALNSLRTDAEKLSAHAREATEALKEVSKQVEERDAQIESIAQEMQQLKSSIPEMVNSVKESQLQLLEGLQSDIRSLRSTVMANASTGGLGSDPARSKSPKPSAMLPPPIPLSSPKVPEWQRKAAAASMATPTSSASQGDENGTNDSKFNDDISPRSISPQSQVNVSV